MSTPLPGETCKFYVSPERPECGDEAVTVVTTKITDRDRAKVPLCMAHKAKYDQQYARRRVEKRSSGASA